MTYMLQIRQVKHTSATKIVTWVDIWRAKALTFFDKAHTQLKFLLDCIRFILSAVQSVKF